MGQRVCKVAERELPGDVGLLGTCGEEAHCYSHRSSVSVQVALVGGQATHEALPGMDCHRITFRIHFFPSTNNSFHDPLIRYQKGAIDYLRNRNFRKEVLKE